MVEVFAKAFPESLSFAQKYATADSFFRAIGLSEAQTAKLKDEGVDRPLAIEATPIETLSAAGLSRLQISMWAVELGKYNPNALSCRALHGRGGSGNSGAAPL